MLSKKRRDNDMSLSEFAYREVREAIRTRRIAPATRVRESDISEMLRISRTPVREAMKRLESEQLLVYRAPRGFVVNSLGLEEAIDLYAVREILEGSAARFASTHATEPELYQMKSLLDMQHNAVDDSDLMARLNEQFHQCIYRAAHNQFLRSALNSLTDALRLLPGTTYLAPNRGKTGLGEHQRIFEAINARNGDLAEKYAREHIVNAGAIRFKMLAEESLSDASRDPKST